MCGYSPKRRSALVLLDEFDVQAKVESIASIGPIGLRPMPPVNARTLSADAKKLADQILKRVPIPSKLRLTRSIETGYWQTLLTA